MNNEHFTARTELLIGADCVQQLYQKCVMVVGLGGVGSYATEALARVGIGNLILIDGDVVSLSNCNRQLYALQSTLGQYKTEVAKQRIHDISPQTQVLVHTKWVRPDNMQEFFQIRPDYIVDAIDQVDAKVALLVEAKRHNLPIISVMGTGNQLTAEHFCVEDISKTHNCPLARAVRLRLRKEGIYSGIKVLYSTRPKLLPNYEGWSLESRRPPGSISFVPPVAGMLAAGEVVRDLLQ